MMSHSPYQRILNAKAFIDGPNGHTLPRRRQRGRICCPANELLLEAALGRFVHYLRSLIGAGSVRFLAMTI